jgi:hypothetical protein
VVHVEHSCANRNGKAPANRDPSRQCPGSISWPAKIITTIGAQVPAKWLSLFI